MALLNHAKKELSAKIVYYGPGLSGKTTNLEWVHRKWEPDKRGKLISLETKTDRTLFFDFLPVQIGEIGGYRTRFNVYTVPGQIFYNETRKMVLKGVDGIVFVADSQQEMASENMENLKNLAENLRIIGKDIKQIPMVLQYNKRDLPNALTVEEMNRLLNRQGVPFFEAIAVQGEGVLTTLARVTRMVADHLKATLFASAREEPEEPKTVPPPAPSAPAPADCLLVSPAAEAPAFLERPRAGESPAAGPWGAEEGGEPESLRGGGGGLCPSCPGAPPEPALAKAPTLELPLIFGEAAPSIEEGMAGEDAQQSKGVLSQPLQQAAPRYGPGYPPANESWLDPSVVDCAPEPSPEAPAGGEISVLLGQPERKTANEVSVPLSIRAEGSGERLTLRLVIRLDAGGLCA